MELQLKMSIDNPAFVADGDPDWNEICEALASVATQMISADGGSIFDRAGNAVGSWEIVDERVPQGQGATPVGSEVDR
jgi:hypothetical protein